MGKSGWFELGTIRKRLAILALVLATLAPTVAQAQQAHPIQGIPIPQVQATSQGVRIAAMPGVLPVIYVPGNFGGLAAPSPAPVAAPTPTQAPVAVAQPAAMAPMAPAPIFEAPAQPVAPGPGDSVGRVFGVFVGISDYPSGNDLQYTAQDAIRVQQAFVNAGIISPLDSVVLQDHRATRVAVSSAIDRLSRQMTANDTLVFFFSGHGNRVPDQNGDERDGQDETIALADGPVLDDELAGLLSHGVGRDIVALDSCYSGGFQQDLARLPNTAGFYASREDQLSYVASEFQAGGYLSYYLAESVTRSHGQPLSMSQLQSDIANGYAQSNAASRQQLTVGFSRSVNTRSVLFSAQPDAPVMVAAR